MSKLFTRNVTRRQVLEVMGIGAAAAALPQGLFAQEPTFPKGAIIRTLLKDYAPEELAGGATLFHEHMQLGPDFNAKFARGIGGSPRCEWSAACPGARRRPCRRRAGPRLLLRRTSCITSI